MKKLKIRHSRNLSTLKITNCIVLIIGIVSIIVSHVTISANEISYQQIVNYDWFIIVPAGTLALTCTKNQDYGTPPSSVFSLVSLF